MLTNDSFSIWRSVLPEQYKSLTEREAWKLRSDAAAQYWLGADKGKDDLVELFDKYVMMKRLLGEFNDRG